MGVIINGKELSINEVEHIVNFWYLKCIPDILQNEDGRDLEEILDVDYTEQLEEI